MLDFEKPLFEIRNKIESLKNLKIKMMWIYKKKLTCLKRHWNEKLKNIYKSKTMGSCANCAFARKTYDPRLYSIYL